MTNSVLCEIHWLDDANFEVGGTKFFTTADPKDTKSTLDRFLVYKARYQTEALLKIGAEVRPQRIMDLGIWQGGSAVLFERAFAPKKLVAVDLGGPVPALDAFIERKGIQTSLKPYYGVNQADRAVIGDIVEREFGNEALDLVIDDASHMLRETRESFNLLFPRVRPGGVYVIEDWGWEHWGGIWQTDKNVFAGTGALTNLIFELCMTVASHSEIVAELTILPSLVVVRRGEGKLGADFDISKSYMVRDPADFAPLFGGARESVVQLARRVRRNAKHRSATLLRSAVAAIRVR